MTRFELATPATRTRCATKLRYIPILVILFSLGSAPTVLPSQKILNGSYFLRQSQAALHPDISYSIFNFYPAH